MKKILCVLNYYYPYISGVSEYARILCEKLVDRGYDVTVLTSNHAKLLEKEKINGVKVVRANIICKISKGTISPQFILAAKKMARAADIVWLHLPMIESGILSVLLDKRKLICTYHCDVNLEKSFLNNFIVKAMDTSNRICLKRSNRILVTSIDYAEHSRIGGAFVSKMIAAGAPIKEYVCGEHMSGHPKKVIGFCGRIVAEKGIQVWLDAFSLISKKRDDVLLKIGGDYKNIAGGSVYPELIDKIKRENIKNVEFLGRIEDESMGEFYSNLDVFVLPSVNSLEAFGMVQIEAMLCGTPVVATDLYGVRTIVKTTGMGVVVKRNNAEELAKGILKVIDRPEDYIKPQSVILNHYGTKKCLEVYEKAFDKLMRCQEYEKI